MGTTHTSGWRRAITRLVAFAVVPLAVLAVAGPAGAASAPSRTKGMPASSNGASSMHLGWADSGLAPTEVSAVVEVQQAPGVGRLWFWALQVDFIENGRKVGGAHLGLQWDATRRGRTAVNFGGYRTDGATTTVLPGTASTLPSANGDPNTRDFRWVPGHHYELRIVAAGGGWWRGEVTDLETKVVTVVRKLHGGGTALVRPMVWSEVFAACDAPPAKVRWSKLTPRPSALRVTYQSYESGGCTNTTSERDGDGFLQRTNTARTIDDRTIVRLDG
jgi:hypothetical protein